MKPGVIAMGFCLVADGATAQDLPIPSVAASPEILWDCLGSGKAAGTCNGAMTIVCEAENDLGNDNLTQRLCIIEETNAWRDLIVRAQVSLSRALVEQPADPVLGNPEDALIEAAETWDAFVAAQCEFERAADARSPLRAIIESQCQRDLSAARYDQLLDTLDRIK